MAPKINWRQIDGGQKKKKQHRTLNTSWFINLIRAVFPLNRIKNTHTHKLVGWLVGFSMFNRHVVVYKSVRCVRARHGLLNIKRTNNDDDDNAWWYQLHRVCLCANIFCPGKHRNLTTELIAHYTRTQKQRITTNRPNPNRTKKKRLKIHKTLTLLTPFRKKNTIVNEWN